MTRPARSVVLATAGRLRFTGGVLDIADALDASFEAGRSFGRAERDAEPAVLTRTATGWAGTVTPTSRPPDNAPPQLPPTQSRKPC